MCTYNLSNWSVILCWVFMLDLNISLLCFLLYAAACWLLSSGLCVMMWSSSLSLILKLLVALSSISMLSGSNTCVGFSCKCVWIDESFLGFRCSLILCAEILSVLPMYVCLHVSQVSPYTTNDCACFSLMLSFKGNSFPISLGALNATLSSTWLKVSFTNLVNGSAYASTLWLLFGRTIYLFCFSTVWCCAIGCSGAWVC